MTQEFDSSVPVKDMLNGAPQILEDSEQSSSLDLHPTLLSSGESKKTPFSKGIEVDDTDSDYIMVTDRDGGTKLELPADSDGTLTITTLAHSFQDAIGLKFRNPSTGVYRALGVDTAGVRIIPPKGGWGNKTFEVIFRPKDSTSGNNTSISSESKRRLDDESDLMAVSKTRRLDEYDSPNVVRKTCDLVVLNLPFKTTSEGLTAYFEKFGKVVVAEVKVDFRTNQPKGFGFVQMCEYEDQCKVLEQYEHFIDGRMTQVKIPNSRGRFGSGMGGRGTMNTVVQYQPSTDWGPSTKMYVGRIPANFSQEEIRAYFDKEARKIVAHAQVEHVLIPKPHRGFAFVTFNDADVTKKLIRIGDFVLNGISICVSPASPKDQQGYASGFTHPSSIPARGGYGYGPGRGASMGDARPGGYGASRDDHWSGGGGQWNSGHPHEQTGTDAYSNYGGGATGDYGGYGQNRAIGQQNMTAMGDGNLQAAWSAFWSTLQGQQQGGSQASAMPSWQWNQQSLGQSPSGTQQQEGTGNGGTWTGK